MLSALKRERTYRPRHLRGRSRASLVMRWVFGGWKLPFDLLRSAFALLPTLLDALVELLLNLAERLADAYEVEKSAEHGREDGAWCEALVAVEPRRVPRLCSFQLFIPLDYKLNYRSE